MNALEILKKTLSEAGKSDDEIQALLDKASEERKAKAKAERDAAKKKKAAEDAAVEASQKKLDDAMGKISDIVKRCGIPQGYQITIQVPESGDIVLKSPRKIPVRNSNGNGPSDLTVERFEEIKKAMDGKSKPSKPSGGKIKIGKIEITEREACQAGLILASLDGVENPASKAVGDYFPGIRKSVSGSWIQKYKQGNGDSALSHFLSDYKANSEKK